MSIRFLALSILAALSIASASCSKDQGTAAKPEPQAPAAGQEKEHASKDAKPGSHEDWCGEHAVPESQCTRCNPDLIPAFKATGDWCKEHDLPESQCLKCNPEIKITRPPKGN